MVGAMRHESLDSGGLSYAPCRYGLSRTYFRGPKKSLDDNYFAFLGGSGTYGKFVEQPFPARLEGDLDQTCVNFGVVNGGIDVYANDPVVMSACQGARATVLQVMGAQNLSNRFYQVLPRRNDRFLSASTVLRALYPEVDFAEFSFTRHMLGALYTRSAEKFEIVRSELQSAWLARMKTLIGQIGSPVVLLWFSEVTYDDTPWHRRRNALQADPLFVDAPMVESLRPMVHDIIVSRPSGPARAEGTDGMVFPLLHRDAANEMPGVMAHKEAAAKLAPTLRGLLPKN